MKIKAAIEQFQHVVDRLELFWGSPEFLDYYQKLSINDRYHREGFPFDVLNDIEFLHALYINHYDIINRQPMTSFQKSELEEAIKLNDVWSQNLSH
jgi:hypothetical protein